MGLMNQTPTIFFTLSLLLWYNYPVNNEIIKNGNKKWGLAPFLERGQDEKKDSS